MPVKYIPAISGSTEWGDIVGTITSQSDLNNLLSEKSPINHNHSLYELSEKSYNSLDDLPNLEIYHKNSDLISPCPAYICDGIDDYIKIINSLFIDVSQHFSIIILARIDEYSENFTIATKINSDSKKGWKLHCNYGVVKFSFGDGIAIESVNHSQTIDENRMYKFSISYDDDNKKLIFGIDDIFEEFVFPQFGAPENSIKDILIAKNDEENEYYKLAIHSFLFLNKSSSIKELREFVRNGRFNKQLLIENKVYVQLLLKQFSFGTKYWFDCSSRDRIAEIFGGLKPYFLCEKLIIPLIGLDDNKSFSKILPANYSVEYILSQNFSNDDCDLTIYIDSDLVIDSETIKDNNEKGFSIFRNLDTYIDSDLEIELSGINIDVSIYIILKKQLDYLWSI